MDWQSQFDITYSLGGGGGEEVGVGERCWYSRKEEGDLLKY